MFKLSRAAIKANSIRYALATCACTLASASASSSNAAEVTVYSVQSIHLTSSSETTIVLLDAAEAIEAELSAKLPHDPAGAVGLARQRLNGGGAKLQHDLAAAYEDIAEAWSLDVATLPAVVVDRRYVVYGEPDVARAVAKIEAFRRTQP